MHDESEPTLTGINELNTWTCAWYKHALEKNFLRLPYRPDDTMIKRIRGYFYAGLSPAEAAEACFGRKH
jgi:hypothetical protein